LLMSNNSQFNITKFALGDDDINYNLLSDSNVLSSGTDAVLIMPTLEATTNENNILKSKLIRTVSNYSEYISSNVAVQQIPADEYSITYIRRGSDSFSLSDYNNENTTFSFALTLNNTLSLSNSFIIDFSNFWKYNNLVFDFAAISPVGFLSSQTVTSNYWYVSDTKNYVINNQVKPVIIGISSLYKVPSSLDLPQAVTNIVFIISLPQESALRLYQYFIQNQINEITDTFTIYNNDSAITPQTSFYGVNSTYTSIAQTIRLTIGV
ncbi:MAG: hypothetical protein ACREQ5_28290, partial [Candidatus Dormibacteria bacterium]